MARLDNQNCNQCLLRVQEPTRPWFIINNKFIHESPGNLQNYCKASKIRLRTQALAIVNYKIKQKCQIRQGTNSVVTHNEPGPFFLVLAEM